MCMPSDVKIKEVESIKEFFKDSKCLVVADYRGLSANEINILRRQIEDTQSQMKVIKNRFVKLIFEINCWGSRKKAASLARK